MEVSLKGVRRIIDRDAIRNHRVLLLAIALGASLALGAFAFVLLGGEKEDSPIAVREKPGSPRPWVGASLDKERSFTYFDTVYGRCLKQNGVKELPPLSKPFVLDTTDPVVVRAADACRSLRPTWATPQP